MSRPKPFALTDHAKADVVAKQRFQFGAQVVLEQSP
jgi:hypothetical protein